MYFGEHEVSAANTLENVKEMMKEYNRGKLERVQERNGGNKEELGNASDEIAVQMLPVQMMQRRKQTTSTFTASDTATWLRDEDVNARMDAIAKLIQYSYRGITTASERMRRLCAEKNKDFVRNCVESGRMS